MKAGNESGSFSLGTLITSIETREILFGIFSVKARNWQRRMAYRDVVTVLEKAGADTRIHVAALMYRPWQ